MLSAASTEPRTPKNSIRATTRFRRCPGFSRNTMNPRRKTRPPNERLSVVSSVIEVIRLPPAPGSPGPTRSGSRLARRDAWILQPVLRPHGLRVALRRLPLPPARHHPRRDSAADVELPGHGDPPRTQRRHQIVEYPVRHLLEEMALVPERPEVELERFQLNAQPVGNIAHHDRPEIGLSGHRAQGGVLRADVPDDVVAIRRG